MEIMTSPPPKKSKAHKTEKQTKTPPTKSPPCKHRIESRNCEVLELHPLSSCGLSGHAHDSNSLGPTLPRQETLFLPLSYVVAYTTRQHADAFLPGIPTLWVLPKVPLRLGVTVCGSKPGAGEAEMSRSGWGWGACQKLFLESHSCVVFSRPTSELHLVLVFKGDSLFPFV